MKKSQTVSAFLLILSTLLFYVGCRKHSQKTELTVLAAASLTDVCAELKTEYENENPNVKLLFSFGGSGALQAQIEAGAPCDLFISAAKKQMKALDEKKLVDKESIKNLLKNEVVLIVPENKENGITSFENVISPSVKMIAIGETESVPVGQYTKTVYENLGLWNSVSAKANYASDVRTVLSWVEEALCDCGIVYATDAAVSKKVCVVAKAPEGSCPEVIYPVGIISASEKKEYAESFEKFLFGRKAKVIFEKAGFVTLGE